MSARAEILQRVRAGLGKGDAAARREAAEAALARPVRGPQPEICGALAERLVDKALSLSSTVDQVTGRAGVAGVAGAAARYLEAQSLALRAVVTADLEGLDWAAAGFDVAVRAAVDTDKVGVSGCFCAIAETGTLMLLSAAPTPASVSLLPETHIAIVPVTRIVATMEDAFALLRAEHHGMPRAVNFISGPSRTGDIEQTIVLGAHGPCRVHLILYGETS